MRNIPIVGAAVCYPPLATGVTFYAPESVAYWFVKLNEATYLNSRDAVSDARAGELAAAVAWSAALAWANLSNAKGGRLPWYVKTPFSSAHPTPAQAAAVSASWAGYQWV
jgi:hypothetical protein